jgi:hypothetical protein
VRGSGKRCSAKPAGQVVGSWGTCSMTETAGVCYGTWDSGSPHPAGGGIWSFAIRSDGSIWTNAFTNYWAGSNVAEWIWPGGPFGGTGWFEVRTATGELCSKSPTFTIGSSLLLVGPEGAPPGSGGDGPGGL